MTTFRSSRYEDGASSSRVSSRRNRCISMARRVSLMIVSVDDVVDGGSADVSGLVLIGSANINERSQRGDRDSELLAVIRDTDMIVVEMT